MKNILTRSAFGNISHTVFSWDGTFVVSVKGEPTPFLQDTQQMLKKEKQLKGDEFHQKGIAFVQDKLDSLTAIINLETKDDSSYENYCTEWLKVSNSKESPFIVHHFDFNEPPYFQFAPGDYKR